MNRSVRTSDSIPKSLLLLLLIIPIREFDNHPQKCYKDGALSHVVYYQDNLKDELFGRSGGGATDFLAKRKIPGSYQDL